MKKWIIFSLLVVIALSGCSGSGGSTSDPATPQTTYPILAGNWAMVAASQVTAFNYRVGGFITNTGGAVSGTLHLLNSVCFTQTQDIPITGTVSTAGIVSVSSATVSGQVVAISGTVASGSLSSGKYTITGGCGNGDHGTVTGFIAPPFSNAYSGTFLSVSKLSIITTVKATQSGPDSDGFYHVSGTATFGGSPCFASGSIAASTVSGSFMSVSITANDGSTVIFDGYLSDSTGKTVSGNYQVINGHCGGDYGTGSLSIS